MSAHRINSPIVYTCLCIVLFSTIHVHSLQFDGTNYMKWKLQHVWKSSTWMVLFICSLPSDTLSATELSIPSPYEHYSTANSDRIWNLSNGQVKLPSSITSFPNHEFHNPIFLGSGGGGAVFSVQDYKTPSKYALKVSWLKSTISVQHECDILQALERSRARHLEVCIGSTNYKDNDKDDRVVIALQPVVENPVASLSSLDERLQSRCVQAIVETLVDCLASNIVTTDVQALINKETGDFWLIDLTESRQMNNPPSFLDLAVASSFCTEMINLIPTKYLDMASKVLLDELQSCESRGVVISSEIFELLENQYNIISNHETLHYVQSKLR